MPSGYVLNGMAAELVPKEISQLQQFDKITLQSIRPLQITRCLNTNVNNMISKEHAGIMLYIFYSRWIKQYLFYPLLWSKF